MALNDPDIELDLVKANLVLPATNITGLAGVATAGTLVSLSDLDAGDRAFTNYLAGGHPSRRAQHQIRRHHLLG